MNVSHRIGAASPLRGRVWPCLGDLAGSAEVTVAGSFDAQDRMLSYGTCQYEYTRNGELTRRTDSASGAVTNYQYDEFGNLRGVDLPDGRVVSYHIDGLNRRVGKSIDGVRQWGLLYANQLEPVAELDGAGNIVASFLYADRPHVPSLMLKGGHTYRILSDHLGSVRLVIDLADGSIAQRLAYDEYGNVIEDTNPGFQPFAYAGGLYDPDTGLTRFGARDYDALAGRWTAKDPIGFGGGAQFFEYAAGDPLNFLDPDGRASVSISVYKGWGLTLTVGAGTGGMFATMTAGVGLELGLSFDPDADIPVKTTDQTVRGTCGFLGFEGQAGVGLGPLSAQYEGHAGLSLTPTEQGTQLDFVENHGPNVAADKGFKLRLGGHGGVHGGVTFAPPWAN
jgi:RHS repeat-associated protein